MIDIVVAPSPSPARLPACRFRFPDPGHVEAEGLIAQGGDLEPSTLVAAYRQGFSRGRTTSPRFSGGRRTLGPSCRWTHSTSRAAWRAPCGAAAFGSPSTRRSGRSSTAARRARRRGSRRPCAAYVRLHGLGWAHSVEVWGPDGALAGGLYGVAIGGLFAAESMFHRATDASNVAVVALVQHARSVGTTLLDVQVPSDHLTTLGAWAIPRDEYLARLAAAVRRPVVFTG